MKKLTALFRNTSISSIHSERNYILIKEKNICKKMWNIEGGFFIKKINNFSNKNNDLLARLSMI